MTIRKPKQPMEWDEFHDQAELREATLKDVELI